MNTPQIDDIHRSLRAVRKNHLAVLFLDIFGFSKISTSFAPELVVDLLNTAFTEWARCVAKNRGYIDKFTGDGLMALFQDTCCSQDAARASLELLASIKEINQKLLSKSLPEIAVGIGLHYGPAIIGNIGSEDRLNFTAIGDTVNLAARFESHTRTVGENTICASAPFRYHAGNAFSWKPLGSIQLKGQATISDAFQLINLASPQLNEIKPTEEIKN
jgi:adenylate cyclase